MQAHFYQETCNCTGCCAMRRHAFHMLDAQRRAKAILVAGLIVGLLLCL